MDAKQIAAVIAELDDEYHTLANALESLRKIHAIKLEAEKSQKRAESRRRRRTVAIAKKGA